jgi:hypothetical protein
MSRLPTLELRVYALLFNSAKQDQVALRPGSRCTEARVFACDGKGVDNCQGVWLWVRRREGKYGKDGEKSKEKVEEAGSRI